MIDIATKQGRIVAAALRLAGEKPWQEISLRDIAAADGLSLAELSDTFKSKAEILTFFMKSVDREVLEKAPAPQAGESPRDALFEVIMARFDILEPHKRALRSIVEAGEIELSMIAPVMVSQGWMLQAAGIDSSGPLGAVRTAGLASVYQSVLRTWLDDDDPGAARTMAVLDRRLRSGESVMSGLNSAVGAARRFKSMLRSAFKKRSPTSGSESDQDLHDSRGASAGHEPGPASPA